MKKITLTIVSAISILLVTEATLAASESIKSRILKQESRIEKGCDKGQITSTEESSLKNEQKNIKEMIENLSSGQAFSVKNKRKVHAALNRSSLHIFKKRYNNEVKSEEHQN
jgi:hypothetical protein